MLMIFQPAGFDLYLAELAGMNADDLNDPLKMGDLARKHDIISMGGVPARDQTS